MITTLSLRQQQHKLVKSLFKKPLPSSPQLDAASLIQEMTASSVGRESRLVQKNKKRQPTLFEDTHPQPIRKSETGRVLVVSRDVPFRPPHHHRIREIVKWNGPTNTCPQF